MSFTNLEQSHFLLPSRRPAAIRDFLVFSRWLTWFHIHVLQSGHFSWTIGLMAPGASTDDFNGGPGMGIHSLNGSCPVEIHSQGQVCYEIGNLWYELVYSESQI